MMFDIGSSPHLSGVLGQQVKIDIETAEGVAATLEAQYLLDCSGRQTVVGNYYNLKKMYEHLQKFSVFAHYENVDRLPGINATLIRMVRGLDRWESRAARAESRRPIVS